MHKLTLNIERNITGIKLISNESQITKEKPRLI